MSRKVSIGSKPTKVLIESAVFMAMLSFVGGYIDAYTFVLRGGVFANNQTGNVAKLGISLSNGNWASAFDALLPMLATIFGAMAAEHLKVSRKKLGEYNWQQNMFVIEIIVMFAVGFIPTTAPHAVANLTLSFIAAFQLSSFRNMEGWVLNTTISTGNLRSVGQYVYNSLFVEKNKEYRAKTVRYILAFTTFILGAFTGTFFSNQLDIKSIWVCIIPLTTLLILHRRSMSIKPAQ